MTLQDAQEIRRLYATGKVTQSTLAKMFRCNQGHISAIVNGKRWSHEPEPLPERIVGNLAEEARWAWLAGFVDADGCISIAKEHDYRKGDDYIHYRPALQISNTDEHTMRYIHSWLAVGGMTKHKRRKRQHRQIYHYMLRNHRELLQVLLQIRPYLVTKAEQADLVIEFIRNRLTAPARGWYKPKRNRMAQLTEKVQALNQP